MAGETYNLDGAEKHEVRLGGSDVENDTKDKKEEYDFGENGEFFYARISKINRGDNGLVSVTVNVKESAFPGFRDSKYHEFMIQAKHYAVMFKGYEEPKNGSVVRGRTADLLKLIGKGDLDERNRIYKTRPKPIVPEHDRDLDDSGEYQFVDVEDIDINALANEEEIEDRKLGK